jgi:hypothetical protein
MFKKYNNWIQNPFSVKKSNRVSYDWLWKPPISSDSQLLQKFKENFVITFWDDLDQKRSALSKGAIRQVISFAGIYLTYFYLHT